MLDVEKTRICDGCGRSINTNEPWIHLRLNIMQGNYPIPSKPRSAGGDVHLADRCVPMAAATVRSRLGRRSPALTKGGQG